ncbi:DUF1194 domain-containing protein [Tabrizicola sp.]|uniref:DUF1194 domain-containing protein n=1 Tax=Tabrizicola sp. TaxID=2005166 RepID=UPI003F39D4B7
MRFNLILSFITLWSGGIPAAGAFASCADLALVLAIDGSGSIDAGEFQLQQLGYSAAFTNDEVLAAFSAAGIVDVAVVIWGDSEMAPQIIPWQRITTTEDAFRMASLIASTPREVTGDTGIGRGISTALDLLQASQACAIRQIINVSGDGVESAGPHPRYHVPLEYARTRAEELGVTVNGLAIAQKGSDLDAWYRDEVIVGPGSFVMTVESFETFGDAIAQKLAREIALPTLAGLTHGMGGKP